MLPHSAINPSLLPAMLNPVTPPAPSEHSEEAPLRCSELFPLRKGPRGLFFEALIAQGVFASDSTFIKPVSRALMPLSKEAACRLAKEFKELGIFELLSHLLLQTQIFPLDPEAAFKVVGSYAFWISGMPYCSSILQELGVDPHAFFSAQELQEAFKRPADIDIRIDMEGASNEQLQKMAQEIACFIENTRSGAKILGLRRKVMDNGINRFKVVSITHNGKKFDLTLISHLYKPFLFGEDDYFLPLPRSWIEQWAQPANQSAYPLTPCGINYGGWHAIPLKLARVKWTDDFNAVDVPGSLKFLLSSIKGAICISKAFEKRMCENFLTILNGTKGPESAIELLHKAVNNHLPGQRYAFTALCFNLHALLGFYFPEKWELWAKLLTKELAKQASSEKTLQTGPMGALHDLLAQHLLPFEVLSSFMLLNGHLLELRKSQNPVAEQTAKLSLTASKSGGRPLTQLRFGEESLILLLSADLNSALDSLLEFISNCRHPKQADTLKLIDKLTAPFFPAINVEFSLNAPLNEGAADSQPEAAKHIEKAAWLLSEHPLTKPIGFLLLCRCGQIQADGLHLDRWLLILLDLLTSKQHPPMRSELLYQFLHHYRRCLPYLPFWNESDQIKSYQALISTATCSKDEILKGFCKLFSVSGCQKISAVVIQAWKMLESSLQPSKYLQVGYDLIDSHLKSNNPAGALLIYSELASSKQSHCKELEAKFRLIFAALSGKAPDFSVLIRLQKAALLFFEKSSGMLKQNFPCQQLIDLLFEKGLIEEGLELIDSITKKSLLSPKQTAETRFASCRFLFNSGKKSASFKQLESCLPLISPELCIPLLIDWRDHLLKEPAADQAALEQLFNLYIKACACKIPEDFFASFIEALMEDFHKRPKWAFEYAPKLLKQTLPHAPHLFEALKQYSLKLSDLSPLEKRLRSYNELLTLPEIMQLIKLIPNALNRLLAHFCVQLIIQPASKPYEMADAAEEFLLFAEKLMTEYGLDFKAAGFILSGVCHQQLNAPKPSFIFADRFADLITSVSSPDLRLLLFKTLCVSFGMRQNSPSFLPACTLLKPKKLDMPELALALCCLLKENKLDCDLELTGLFWAKLAQHSASFGLELIGLYLYDDLEITNKILYLLQTESNHLKNGWENKLDKLLTQAQNKRSLNPLSTDQYLLLCDAACLMLEKADKPGPTAKINISWLIHDLVKTHSHLARKLFLLAQEHHLFYRVAKQDHALQLQLCRQLLSENHQSEAFHIIRRLIDDKLFTSVIPLLIDQARSAPNAELLDLLLLCFQAGLPAEIGTPLAECFAECFMQDDSHAVKITPKLACSLLNHLKMTNHPALLNTFFSKLIDWGNDVLAIVEETAVFSEVLLLFKNPETKPSAMKWLGKIASTCEPKRNKTLNPLSAELYYELANLFVAGHLPRAHFYLLKALSAPHSPSLASNHQVVCMEVLSHLLQEGSFSHALDLAHKVTERLPVNEWDSLLNSCYSRHLKPERKLEFHLDLIEKLLRLNTQEGLGLAVEKLLDFSDSLLLALDAFSKLINSALNQFHALETSADGSIKRGLQLLLDPKFQAHASVLWSKLDPIGVLNFYAQEQDLHTLVMAMSNCIPAVLNKLAQEKALLNSKAQKSQISGALSKIMQRLKNSAFLTLNQITLSHACAPLLYSPNELSQLWAEFILDHFYFIGKGEEALHSASRGLTICKENLHHLTHIGPVEIECLDKTIDALFVLHIGFGNFGAFLTILNDLFCQFGKTTPLKTQSAWNMHLPLILAAFETFQNDLDDVEYQPITSGMRYYLQQIASLFTEEQALAPAESLQKAPLFTAFIDRFIAKLITYQTGTPEVHLILQAHLFLYIHQASRLSLLSPDKIYAHLFQFCHRFVGVDCITLYNFHFKMVNLLFSTVTKLTKASLKADSIYELQLILTLNPYDIPMHLQLDRKSIAERIILSLARQPSLGHLNRALIIFFRCQQSLFRAEADTLKRCYAALFDAVRMAPFMSIQNDRQLLEKEGSASLLLYCLGRIILDGCSEELLSPTSKSSLSRSKIDAFFSNLCCQYFELVIECYKMCQSGKAYHPKNQSFIEECLVETFLLKRPLSSQPLHQTNAGKWIPKAEMAPSFSSPPKEAVFTFLSEMISEISKLGFSTPRYLEKLRRLTEQL